VLSWHVDFLLRSTPLRRSAARGVASQLTRVSRALCVCSRAHVLQLQREVAGSPEDKKTIRRGRNVLTFCGAIELVLRHGLARCVVVCALVQNRSALCVRVCARDEVLGKVCHGVRVGAKPFCAVCACARDEVLGVGSRSPHTLSTGHCNAIACFLARIVRMV
jgi:hypothetical protein